MVLLPVQPCSWFFSHSTSVQTHTHTHTGCGPKERVLETTTEDDGDGKTVKVTTKREPITPNCVEDLETRVQGVADLYSPSGSVCACVCVVASMIT